MGVFIFLSVLVLAILKVRKEVLAAGSYGLPEASKILVMVLPPSVER
jgi:hypothetical protein